MRYNKHIIRQPFFLSKIFEYVCYCFKVKSLVIGHNNRVNEIYSMLEKMCTQTGYWWNTMKFGTSLWFFKIRWCNEFCKVCWILNYLRLNFLKFVKIPIVWCWIQFLSQCLMNSPLEVPVSARQGISCCSWYISKVVYWKKRQILF